MTRLAASTLVLSPLFALASSAVAPRLESDPGAQLAVIAADPARWYCAIARGGTGFAFARPVPA